jgi:nitrite reductase/ring-hydroxylating ferredoxin subunit
MARRRIVVCRADELGPGRTAKFPLPGREGETRRRTGFVLNYQGALRAYVNECAHIAISLDVFDNDFFDEERRYLVCAMHGACYEPETGACVSGPPLGASLDTLDVTREDDEIVVYVE